jgi:prevent-host-death family protein
MAKRERVRKTEATAPQAVTTAPVPAREAQRSLGELLSRAGFGRERIPITRNGKQIAALVSAQDLETLQGAA